MTDKETRNGFIAITTGVALLGTGPIFVKTVNANGIIVGFYRMLFAGVMLTIPALYEMRKKPATGSSKPNWGWALMGSLVYAVNIALWCTALNFTTASAVTLLDTTAPVWVGLFGWLFLGKKYPGSYWLGLAFQSPSLMSVVLCVVWVARSLEKKPFTVLDVTSKNSQPTLLASAGILLGWVLLGDTLAWWPVSIYAWGFSTWALALTCVPAFSLWCINGPDHDDQAFTIGFSVVLLLFVVTRLPSGNLWDALLDPWLWIILQVMGLRVLILRLLHLLRVSPATRA